jgi:UDP-GlcNAc:undecaprenyl-phosphate GlcNAc-1-phosphate transferase
MGKKVLIYGAGHGGQLVARELVHDLKLQMEPIGFIDEDPALLGRTVNRLPVLGSGKDLARLLDNRSVSALIVSSYEINGERLEQVVRLCREREIAVLRCTLNVEPVPIVQAERASIG